MDGLLNISTLFILTSAPPLSLLRLRPVPDLFLLCRDERLQLRIIASDGGLVILQSSLAAGLMSVGQLPLELSFVVRRVVN